MGYYRVDMDEVEPTPDRPCVRRSTSESADVENVAVGLYGPELDEEDADEGARVLVLGTPAVDDVHPYER